MIFHQKIVSDLKWCSWILLYLTSLFISSCGNNIEQKSSENNISENHIVSKAERFSLEPHDGYTKLTIINPWQGAKNVFQTYYLVEKGNKMPDGIDSLVVIYVPLKSIICMSTTHVAMISALDEESTISGVSGKDFIFSESLVEQIDLGHVEDVGFEANLNKELILKISPDLIMIYGIGSESAGYLGKIEELGIKVIFNADYLEADPLSKAEWIKLFGALYCKEKIADSIYQNEVLSYNNIRSYIIQNTRNRPKVLLGLPFKDTWYISPGNSFASTLIKDAGGEYLWQDTESAVSMPMGIENVFIKAMDAEFWLNIGSAKTKDEISIIDQRLMELSCFKNGNLYNNNNRISPDGGNDYWESGSIYPHIILKDLASILHPNLFRDYELYFYRKII